MKCIQPFFMLRFVSEPEAGSMLIYASVKTLEWQPDGFQPTGVNMRGTHTHTHIGERVHRPTSVSHWHTHHSGSMLHWIKSLIRQTISFQALFCHQELLKKPHKQSSYIANWTTDPLQTDNPYLIFLIFPCLLSSQSQIQTQATLPLPSFLSPSECVTALSSTPLHCIVFLQSHRSSRSFCPIFPCGLCFPTAVLENWWCLQDVSCPACLSNKKSAFVCTLANIWIEE